MKISISLVKESMKKEDAEILIKTIFEDVISITGQNVKLSPLVPYSIDFQILESSLKGKVLYKGFKGKNSNELQWS